jgi:predicted amidophosphoribosyltransferase
MICEKCANEIETTLCPQCGNTVAKLGPYCYGCGATLEKIAEKREEEDELDLSARILCSDDSCIGVVNEQGICKVCGKPYTPESQA